MPLDHDGMSMQGNVGDSLAWPDVDLSKQAEALCLSLLADWGSWQAALFKSSMNGLNTPAVNLSTLCEAYAPCGHCA